MRAAIALIALLMTGLPAGVYAGDDNRPIAAMDHVAISVIDLDKSAAFYLQMFGFREVRAPVPNARWLVMANGVMLHIVGNRRAPASHERWDHMAIACDDLDAFIARLDARKLKWTNMAGGQVPQIRSDGVRQIFVQDPDGYWIEVNDGAKRR